MKWEDNLQDDPAEEKTETVRGKKVVFSREGSGITTSYVANVYGDVSDKYPLGPYQDEIARVVSKVEKTFAPTDPDTQRAILKSGMLQFPKRKGGDAAEEDEIKPTTVEEEDW